MRWTRRFSGEHEADRKGLRRVAELGKHVLLGVEMDPTLECLTARAKVELDGTVEALEAGSFYFLVAVSACF